MATLNWKPLGPGGEHFRATRPDGRRADVYYEPNGTWLAYVERQPSGIAATGEQVRLGAFPRRAGAKLAAGRWTP